MRYMAFISLVGTGACRRQDYDDNGRKIDDFWAAKYYSYEDSDLEIIRVLLTCYSVEIGFHTRVQPLIMHYYELAYALSESFGSQHPPKILEHRGQWTSAELEIWLELAKKWVKPFIHVQSRFNDEQRSTFNSLTETAKEIVKYLFIYCEEHGNPSLPKTVNTNNCKYTRLPELKAKSGGDLTVSPTDMVAYSSTVVPLRAHKILNADENVAEIEAANMRYQRSLPFRSRTLYYVDDQDDQTFDLSNKANSSAFQARIREQIATYYTVAHRLIDGLNAMKLQEPGEGKKLKPVVPLQPLFQITPVAWTSVELEKWLDKAKQFSEDVWTRIGLMPEKLKSKNAIPWANDKKVSVKSALDSLDKIARSLVSSLILFCRKLVWPSGGTCRHVYRPPVEKRVETTQETVTSERRRISL